MTLLFIAVLFSGCMHNTTNPSPVDSTPESQTTHYTTEVSDIAIDNTHNNNLADEKPSITLNDIPAYSGLPFVEINNNVPFFTAEELTTDAFEH